MTRDEMQTLARRRTAAGGTTPMPLPDAARICDVRPDTIRAWMARGWVARQPCPSGGRPRSDSVTVDLGQVAAVRDISFLRPAGCPLTYRQIHVIRLAASGLTNQEIGARLGCSEGAAGNAMKKALDTIGARNRTHGVVILLALNLIGFQDIDLPEEVA